VLFNIHYNGLFSFNTTLMHKLSRYTFRSLQNHPQASVNYRKVLFNKTNRRNNFPNLFLSRNSKCFGQFLCPSSGVSRIYIRHWYMSSNLHDIYQCRMYSGKLLTKGRGTARNM